MIMPTITLPPTTKWPKALITWPALAFNRIRRVDATFRDNRKSVVNSSSDGKVENSSDFPVLKAISSMSREHAMFNDNSTSNSGVGTGTMRTRRTPTTATASATSLCFAKYPTVVSRGKAGSLKSMKYE